MQAPRRRAGQADWRLPWPPAQPVQLVHSFRERLQRHGVNFVIRLLHCRDFIWRATSQASSQTTVDSAVQSSAPESACTRVLERSTLCSGFMLEPRLNEGLGVKAHLFGRIAKMRTKWRLPLALLHAVVTSMEAALCHFTASRQRYHSKTRFNRGSDECQNTFWTPAFGIWTATAIAKMIASMVDSSMETRSPLLVSMSYNISRPGTRRLGI
ncbi:hypothetical protein CONLIGDRAFT_143573 [Coniochaeta ligniaria NRRL 30616]|uniref:Uncharacterized protein n=1 Tax=Coniochaeta ligniaria NRRL 30616 TaxID=1408157 RepID=A0A1J7I736_9PEZI|nr:hypothetical protein CONLIGDRAFT_143573 [Coniochaeta ligniaria NRRL 30616]